MGFTQAARRAGTKLAASAAMASTAATANKVDQQQQRSAAHQDKEYGAKRTEICLRHGNDACPLSTVRIRVLLFQALSDHRHICQRALASGSRLSPISLRK